MMRKISVVIFFLAIIFTACDSNRIYEEHKKTGKKNVWNRFEQMQYDVNIEEPGNYTIIVAIRHAQHYPYANINIDFEMVKPNGENRITPLKIMLKDEETGKFMGKGAGDIWDFEYPVYENINFADTGNYHFEIDNVMPVYDLPGIMEIGLVVEKNE